MADSFQLKGRLFTLSVLSVTSNDLTKLRQTIAAKVKLAPNFFQFSPVVIDVSELNWQKEPIDLAALKDLLKEFNLIPTGIKNLPDNFLEAAANLGLAKLTDQQPSPSQPTVHPEGCNRLITQPIRSGQQIYAPGGDLIVLSSVSPGAELLADGNIHVYGTLRGRVLAGVNGDSNARIFCQKLEAELVAIAGHYKIFEELETQSETGPKQISLVDEQLIVSTL